ncbi:MAG: Ig-like domain-containing protein [Bacteroidota bacterium]
MKKTEINDFLRAGADRTEVLKRRPFTNIFTYSLLIAILFFADHVAQAQFQVGDAINGGTERNDRFGISVSLSDDGSILAVAQEDPGIVRVYENQSGAWVQIGQDLVDQIRFAEVVSLNGDGTILAIGAPTHIEEDITNTSNITDGEVRVYEFQTDTWVQKGQTLNGVRGDRLGVSVDLSTDGTIMIVGNHLADDNGTNSGEAIVYEFSGGSWVEVGQHIVGETDFDFVGRPVTISSDGSRVAISAAQNDNAIGADAGFTKIYELQTGSWVQVGQTILAEAAEDNSGVSIDLNDDGSIIAVGSTRNDGNGADAGHVRIFELLSTTWTQIGQDIEGEAAGDFSGFLSISGSGDRVAIAANANDGGATDAGHVRIYDNQAGNWVQVSEDIDGLADLDFSGAYNALPTIALSKDGNVLAYGAPFRDINEFNDGQVRVFNALDNQAPDVINPLPDITLDQGFRTELVNFGSVFQDPNGDGFTVTFSSSNTAVATVSRLSSNLVISEGTEAGTTDISLTANDGDGGVTTDVFTLTVIIPDTESPTVTVSTTANNPTNAGSIPFTITFSEEVTDFIADDISITNATVADFSTTDNIVYQFNAIAAGEGKITVTIPERVAEDLAGNDNVASDEVSITVDQTRPSVTTATTTTSPTNATSIAFTITFSEAVNGFVAGDISLDNGNVSNFSTSDNTVFTFTATSIAAGSLTMGVNSSVATDDAGNANTSSIFRIFTIDRTGPTAVISSTEDSPTNATTVPITVTFSERVSGLTTSDVSVTNATISGISTTDNTVFTFNVFPIDEGTVNVSIPDNVTTDLAGNNNVASNQLSLLIDQTQPTVVLSTAVSSPTNADMIAVTATFSEEMSGFVVGDISVSNGSVSGFSTNDDVVFTFDVTPVAGTLAVEVLSGVATDLAGNTNLVSNELSFVIDQTRPDVTISSTVTGTTNLSTIPIMITFTEEMSSFGVGDISVTNGTVDNFATTDNTVYTMDVNVAADGDVIIDVPENVAADLVGNDNNASNTLTVTVDQTPPSIGTKATTQSSVTSSQVIDYRYVWREEVVGFTADDLDVSNGTVSDFATSDNITFTFNVNATARGTVTISVPPDIVTDLAGNSNLNNGISSIFYEPYKRWVGTVSNDWNEVGNWLNGEVPEASDGVNIPNRSNDPVIADGEDITIVDLIMDAGADLLVASGGSVTSDDITMASTATMMIQSNSFVSTTDLALNGPSTRVTVKSGGSLAVAGSMSGTGFVSVEKNVADNAGLSAIGSPITNQTIEMLSTDIAFRYDEASNTFHSKTGMMQPGEGVFTGFSSLGSTVTFTGTLNTGTIEIPLSRVGNDDNGISDGFNLVSNPYAAAISRSDFISANSTHIDGNIWLWSDGGQNAGGNRAGDYIVVNDMGATTVSDADAVGGTKGIYDEVNDAINSVQGFFVLANSGADGQDLTFNPTMQITTGNADANFFRGSANSVNREIVKLSLSGTGDNSPLYNEIIVGLDENATEGYDFALDALKFSGNDQISFFSINDEKPYAIQALPKLKEEVVTVTLGFELNNIGTYKINVVELQTGAFGATIFLLDQLSGKEYDLSLVDEITFDYQNDLNNDRFALQFRPSQVTTSDVLFENSLELISGDQHGIDIRFRQGQSMVTIYDLNGKALLRELVEFGTGSQRLELPIDPAKLYILRIDNEVIKFRID